MILPLRKGLVSQGLLHLSLCEEICFSKNYLHKIFRYFVTFSPFGNLIYERR